MLNPSKSIFEKACTICKKAFCWDCSEEGITKQLSKGEIKHQIISFQEFVKIYPEFLENNILVDSSGSIFNLKNLLCSILNPIHSLRESKIKNECDREKAINQFLNCVKAELHKRSKEYLELNQLISLKLLLIRRQFSLIKHQIKLNTEVNRKLCNERKWKEINIKNNSLLLKATKELDLRLINQDNNKYSKLFTQNLSEFVMESSLNKDLQNCLNISIKNSMTNKEEGYLNFLNNIFIDNNNACLKPYFQMLNTECSFNQRSNSDKIMTYLFLTTLINELQKNANNYRNTKLKEFEIYKIFHLILSKHSLFKDQNKYPCFHFFSGRFSSFHKDHINSHFLFYLEFVESLPSVLHVKNLISSEKTLVNLYTRTSEHKIDCEQHQGYIFAFGGYNANGPIKTCMGINLLNLPKIETITNEMKRARSWCAPVSTFNYIYMIGGHFGDPYYGNYCEKYDLKKNEWEEINPLNVADFGITTFFCPPFQIYTCGGYGYNSYERLLIDPSIKNHFWEKLQLDNPTTQRAWGIAYILNSIEVLLFGGYSAPTEFYIYDFVNKKIANTNKQFAGDKFYNTSKGRFFNGFLYIASYEPIEIYKVDINQLKFEKVAKDF